MPEYAALSTRYSTIPDALFAAYIKSEPRNICEFIIRIRIEGRFVSPLLGQVELHEALRRGLERESNLNYLGWAMLVLSVADHRNGWRVLKDMRFDGALRDVINGASPGETSLLLFNLSKVSQTKGAECLECIPPENMARTVQSMGLGRAGATLGLVRDFSREYFERVAESLEGTAVCQQVLIEDNLDELRLGLRKFSQLLGDRVCIKVSETEDALGEPLNRLSFYFDTIRVVRFLKGRGIGIPYGVSVSSQYAYWKPRRGNLWVMASVSGPSR